jgi:very-short-patch-repair endonuclease
MKISDQTISALAEVITGNNRITPYRTGPKLVEFFNQLGWHEVYDQGFPSRQRFTESKVREANGTSKLDEVVQATVDPRGFLGTNYNVEEVVKHLNQFLKYDDYEIAKSGIFYRVQRSAEFDRANRTGAKVRNIVFAANGPKPEIVLADAITNEIQIVKNAEYCLVYDREVSDDDGLLWNELVDWWCKRNQAAKKTRDEQKAILLARLMEALNEVEQKFLVNYHVAFAAKLGDKLPALIPQVYLHYDPYTLKQLSGQRRLLRQRMDFLLLLPKRRRVVLEIDGIQHYSENGSPSPRLYAEMVSEDRRLKLAGYEVYRFGGYELQGTDLGRLVTDFFESLFGKQKNAV